MARLTKVEKYAAIRRDSRVEGLSQRELARKNKGQHPSVASVYRVLADGEAGEAADAQPISRSPGLTGMPG